MKRNNFLLFSIIIAALLIAVAFYFFSFKNTNRTDQMIANISPTQTLLGGDRDEHGCIPSAGYSWCEAKQKCLREWEEKCEAATGDEEQLETEIKEALIAKHGQSAAALNVSVSKLVGDYAQGGASEQGMGGGMWFAAKVNGKWELVWDGNGIITCDTLVDYPEFPSDMIPQCFNETNQTMVDR